MPKHLHRDLEQLSKRILNVGALVQEALDKAVTALMERRIELAEEVIANDILIDQHELEVEEDCLKILALHQPVAADLRYVIAALKVNNDLERMGDHAASIASRAKYLSKRDPIGAADDISSMALNVREMVTVCLDALVQRDAEKARQVCLMDDTVDNSHKRMFKLLSHEMMEDKSTVKRAVHSLSVSRHLERIADLATNIAQDVVFMVEGEVIRHQPVEMIAESTEGDL
jgi:phosphate transport system protein